jgi:hypothetical protein
MTIYEKAVAIIASRKLTEEQKLERLVRRVCKLVEEAVEADKFTLDINKFRYEFSEPLYLELLPAKDRLLQEGIMLNTDTVEQPNAHICSGPWVTTRQCFYITLIDPTALRN